MKKAGIVLLLTISITSFQSFAQAILGGGLGVKNDLRRGLYFDLGPSVEAGGYRFQLLYGFPTKEEFNFNRYHRLNNVKGAPLAGVHKETSYMLAVDWKIFILGDEEEGGLYFPLGMGFQFIHGQGEITEDYDQDTWVVEMSDELDLGFGSQLHLGLGYDYLLTENLSIFGEFGGYLNFDVIDEPVEDMYAPGSWGFSIGTRFFLY